MMNSRYAGRLAVLGVLWAGLAGAQTPAAQQSERSATDTATRLSTPTADGDTGLWYVPTAETLVRGTWSASGYRVGTNYRQGFTNVADFPLTFGVGVTNRAELFGSFKAVTRIDRDVRPVFTSEPNIGGIVGRYPLVKQGWSGNQLGDLTVGLKYNLLSQAAGKKGALAVRGGLKLPTGDKATGVSTGKADGFVDLIMSREAASVVEYSVYAGGIVRGTPDGASASNGLRYGIGAGFPSRSLLRFTAEYAGEKPFDDTVTLTKALVSYDGASSVLSSPLGAFNATTVGFTWQDKKGFFAGVAATWTQPGADRSKFRTDDNRKGDFFDYQVRVGYYPGGARSRFAKPLPPPAPAPPPPPPPVAPQNRPPTVQARCEPCTVEVGKTSNLTAVAQDPDGDTLTYRWTVPAGSPANPADRQTVWTAPMVEGPVQATVTVDDGKGGTASANTTVQVVKPAPIVELNFEDVYFEFDRSSLRPDALRLLDDAVNKLQANPTKNLIIEGHTCNIGTAEYNLALGERRARAVVDYLSSRGVSSGRLEIRSYGEERPKYDNAREETRRLNRRAALVVKVQ